VEDLRKMLSRLVGEDVSLEVLLSENAGNVLADPGRIEQVIVNLAVNARDAMPGGGTLTLETSMRRIGAQGLPRHPQIGPGVYACILVRDTGQGIGAEALEHLFEPFYTTKEQGKGTGLGLATSYGIVKQSGGFIFCDSRPGGGTSFTIYLPRVEGGETPAAASGATERQTGRETVLLVEDEGMVRTFTRRILEQSGYAVVEAGDGPSALAAAEKLGDSLDLLVTDVVMPVMGGREVAERIRKMRRGVRTLFISGYAEEAVERHGHLAGDAPLIQKPFTAQAFLATIRQILDSRPPLG
jgi:CheY-like chemotaxis protein